MRLVWMCGVPLAGEVLRVGNGSKPHAQSKSQSVGVQRGPKEQ